MTTTKTVTKKTVAVDLDGVLAKYDGWRGVGHIGDPIQGAQDFLNKLQRLGFEVLIFTTRCHPDVNVVPAEFHPESRDRESMWKSHLRRIVEVWLEKFQMPHDRVYQGVGKPIATAYVDDRAVVCRPQEEMSAFETALAKVQELRG